MQPRHHLRLPQCDQFVRWSGQHQDKRVPDVLVARGVSEAVLCPGSRNAPLSFALHRTGKEWLFFDRWAFDVEQLPTVDVRADTTNEIVVNGFPAPLAEGRTTLPVLLPAVVEAESFSPLTRRKARTGAWARTARSSFRSR